MEYRSPDVQNVTGHEVRVLVHRAVGVAPGFLRCRRPIVLEELVPKD